MFSIDLQWKRVILSGSGTKDDPYVYGDLIPVSMAMVEAWMKANAGSDYCGNSAHANLSLWFTENPGDDVNAAIQSYWNGLNSSSSEATSYQTAAQIKAASDAASAAALASATSKLVALGLSDAEIAALSGK